MDDFVKKILIEFSLEEYLPNFEREEIDEDSCRLLDSKTLEVLIPKAGPRLKFKSKLDDFSSSSSKPSIGDISTYTSDILKDCVFSNINESVSISNVDAYSSDNVNQSVLSDVDSIHKETSEERGSPQPCASESAKKTLDLEQIVHLKLPEIFTKLKLGDPSQINILQKHQLNRLIVDKYIERYGCQPTTQEKINLAKSVVNTFPILKGNSGEGFEQWLCPGTNGTSASGFIAQRFRNFRHRKLSSCERVELSIGRASKLSSQIAPVLGRKDTSIEFLQKQQWLIENDRPLEKVLNFMRDTFEGRRYDILNTKTEDIVQSWPRLLNPHVIDADFTRIYGEKKSDSLCSEFGLISSQIIFQAKNCGIKSAEDLAGNLPFDLSDPETASERICCAIQLLPFLLPQGTIVKQSGQKKRKIRPTNGLSLDHFIQFIPIGEGLEKFMRVDRTLGGDRKQPFILAVGEKYSPLQTFVICENNCITTTSLLKSVDICFKLTYILNLEFSPYCRNV